MARLCWLIFGQRNERRRFTIGQSQVSLSSGEARNVLKRRGRFASLTSDVKHLVFGTLEQAEERRRRFEQRKLFDRARSLKRERKKGLTASELSLVNIFREYGISYWSMPPQDAFALVPKEVEGRKASTLSRKALHFLAENFNVEQIEDPDGRVLLHFFKSEDKGEDMASFFGMVAEKSGQPRRVVREVYEAFVKVAHRMLKETRAVRIPELGKIRISFRPAKPKRKGINPFTKKPAIFKAKPAMNKIRFRPFRDLKEFIAGLPIVEPKKKKKKNGKKKKHNKD
jgi:nucleoid DNA-binding protein